MTTLKRKLNIVLSKKLDKQKMRNQFVKREEIQIKMLKMHLGSDQVAKSLGITRQSFWNKLRGKNDFTESEIAALKTLFGTSVFF